MLSTVSSLLKKEVVYLSIGMNALGCLVRCYWLYQMATVVVFLVGWNLCILYEMYNVKVVIKFYDCLLNMQLYDCFLLLMPR